MGRKTAEERFWSKVRKQENGCWIWTAAVFNGPHGGYGCFAPCDGRNAMPAHRFAWELVNGPLPAGKLLHHKCRVRQCVNPDHLLLTAGYSDHMRHHRKTHCSKGHPLVEKYGRQICPTCRLEQHYRDRARHPERHVAEVARWRVRHPEKYREQLRANAKHRRERRKVAA